MADCDRLKQILLNLVGNAIKFTEKGEVLVRVALASRQSQEVMLSFSVTDTGPGISKEGLSSIFDPFVQGIHIAYLDQPRGAGLGLTISARLVEMMRGKIWAESEVGKGSVFHFTCPCMVPSQEPQSSTASAGMQLQSVLNKESLRAQKSLHILVAEDDVLSQKMITRVLEKWGHTIETADNGLEAVSRIDKGNFDLVLMDVQMPGLDGFQVTASVREKEKDSKRHIPIIALTAYAIKGEEERCLESGMDAYITKPIDMNKLFELVEAQASKVGKDVNLEQLPSIETINMNALRARVGEDRGLLQELAQIFVGECPKWKSEIRCAMSNSVSLKAIAHKISGSLQNLSATSAASAAATLESKAEVASLTELESLVDNLEQQLERLSDVLNELILEKV
ncbi:MAG: response regulator [Candidatus Melainabacteria bacterium]|nr:response regulator [Candidatus Melainabacteria bacterium]